MSFFSWICYPFLTRWVGTGSINAQQTLKNTNNVTCSVSGCDRSALFLLVWPLCVTPGGCWAASHFVTLCRTRREREQRRNEVLNIHGMLAPRSEHTDRLHLSSFCIGLPFSSLSLGRGSDSCQPSLPIGCKYAIDAACLSYRRR